MFSPAGKQWWNCDDTQITRTNFNDLDKRGYLYLFRKM